MSEEIFMDTHKINLFKDEKTFEKRYIEAKKREVVAQIGRLRMKLVKYEKQLAKLSSSTTTTTPTTTNISHTPFPPPPPPVLTNTTTTPISHTPPHVLKITSSRPPVQSFSTIVLPTPSLTDKATLIHKVTRVTTATSLPQKSLVRASTTTTISHTPHPPPVLKITSSRPQIQSFSTIVRPTSSPTDKATLIHKVTRPTTPTSLQQKSLVRTSTATATKSHTPPVLKITSSRPQVQSFSTIVRPTPSLTDKATLIHKVTSLTTAPTSLQQESLVRAPFVTLQDPQRYIPVSEDISSDSDLDNTETELIIANIVNENNHPTGENQREVRHPLTKSPISSATSREEQSKGYEKKQKRICCKLLLTFL